METLSTQEGGCAVLPEEIRAPPCCFLERQWQPMPQLCPAEEHGRKAPGNSRERQASSQSVRLLLLTNGPGPLSVMQLQKILRDKLVQNSSNLSNHKNNPGKLQKYKLLGPTPNSLN